MFALVPLPNIDSTRAGALVESVREVGSAVQVGGVNPLLTLWLVVVAAYVVRGVSGVGSAIVFNPLFVLLTEVGATGSLTLLDGLYWLALADAFAAVLMLVLVRGSLRLDKSTVLVLVGLLPVSAYFTLMLPSIDTGSLGILVSLTVVGAGAVMGFMPLVPQIQDRAHVALALPAGGLAGILGGLFGMAGPVLIVFLASARPDPSRFRQQATVIGVAGLVRLFVLDSNGAFANVHLEWSVLILPTVAASVMVGSWAHRFIRPQPFRLGLTALVLAAGVTGLFLSGLTKDASSARFDPVDSAFPIPVASYSTTVRSRP